MSVPVQTASNPVSPLFSIIGIERCLQLLQFKLLMTSTRILLQSLSRLRVNLILSRRSYTHVRKRNRDFAFFSFERTQRQPHPHLGSHPVMQSIRSAATTCPTGTRILQVPQRGRLCCFLYVVVIRKSSIAMYCTCSIRTIHNYIDDFLITT